MNLMELAVKAKIPVDKNIPIPEPKRRGRPPGSKNKTPIPDLDTKAIEKATINNILSKRLLPFIGKPVQYYDEGYRVGTLVTVNETMATIKPPLNGRSVNIPVEDVKGVE